MSLLLLFQSGDDAPPITGVGAEFCGPAYAVTPYAGLLACLEDSQFPDPGGGSDGTNLENVDDSGGRLGCGVPNVFIAWRCGTVFCTLGADDSISSLTYDRRLDDISEAEVVITLGGSAESTCCACLAEAEPWCHELWIQRNGRETWAGPITEIIYGYGTVTIRALDRMAWATVRIPEGDIDYTGAPTDLVVIAEDILQVAFAEDADVTCELDAMYTANSGVLQNAFFPAFETNAYESIQDLAERGLDFTTIAGTISLTGDLSAQGRALALLTDELIVGDVEVKKSGLTQGNRWYVNFDGDLGLPAVSDPVDEFCYGPIERQRTGDDILDQTQAEDVANAFAAAAGIAPRTIEIPPGAKLSPDTPWDFNDMICGIRVDVAITKLCVSMTSSFRLTKVEVTYKPGDEEIGVTLSPLNSVE